MEKFHQHRVTLLPGVLAQGRWTLCLATGEEKAEALHQVLRGPFDPMKTPSQIAPPEMAWYIDRGAAAAIQSAE